MATLSEMASGIAKQATSIGMEAATLALRLADAECKPTEPGAPPPANFASVGSPFTSDRNPAPVYSDLVERACTAFMTVPWTPKQPQHLREPIAAVVRLVQQDSDARFKKALMVSNGFMLLTDAEISDILARIAAPPTLQERITERFKTQRCINSSVWNPEELAKIAVEEAKKEVK